MAELKAVYLLGIALERKLHGMMVFGHSKLIVEWFRGNTAKEAAELHVTTAQGRGFCCHSFMKNSTYDGCVMV